MSIGRLGAGDTAIQPTIFDAKADLLTATAADTPARIAVGNDGETLVADSSQSTGLRYNPPVGSLANPVINGGMDNWQRGTSISVTASTSPYTADRWQVSVGANQASTVSRQATGDTTNLPNIQYAARVQRNSGQTGTGAIAFVQSFETSNSVPFAGKAVTVSFYARKGADYSASNSSLSLDFISGTGTDQNRISAGYTGNANVFSNGVTLTTSWQRFVFTGTVGATATELATYFFFAPTGTAGTNDYFELTGVQIDVGTWTASTAPAFRRSGGTIAGELAACQRYYTRFTGSTYAQFGSGWVANSTLAVAYLQLPVQMRIAPSSMDYSASIDFVDVQSTALAATSLSLQSGETSQNVAKYNMTISGGTAYRFGIVRASNSATSYVGFSAEL